MLKNAFVIGIILFVVLWGGNYMFASSQIDHFESQQVKMVHLSREMNQLQQYKFLINQFYAVHNRFPDNSEELDMLPHAMMRNTNVTQRTIGPKGVIKIAFAESIGENAALTLIPIPNLSRRGASIQWRCIISGLETSMTAQLTLGTECENLPADINVATLIEENKPKATTDSLIKAVQNRRESLVKDLISQGVDVNGSNTDGDTPLSIAVENGNSTMVKLLIKAGGNVHQRLSTDKKTLLMHAIDEPRGRSSTMIRTLLKAGLNIETRDKSGKTALIYAAINDDSTSLRALMNAGANIKVHDRNGLRAINYAKKHGSNSSTYQALYNAENRPVEIIIKLPEENF